MRYINSLLLLLFIILKVGWLEYNGTFSTAISCQELMKYIMQGRGQTHSNTINSTKTTSPQRKDLLDLALPRLPCLKPSKRVGKSKVSCAPKPVLSVVRQICLAQSSHFCIGQTTIWCYLSKHFLVFSTAFSKVPDFEWCHFQAVVSSHYTFIADFFALTDDSIWCRVSNVWSTQSVIIY